MNIEPLVDVVDLDSEAEDPLLHAHGKNTPTSSQSSSPPKKNNRRKSKLLIRNDDNITFESDVINKADEISFQSSFKNKGFVVRKKKPEKEPGPSGHIQTETLEQMMSENPNFESMQRVAFLRACVNYMLKVKDLPTIDFNSMETVTLSKLVNTYNGITRIVPKNDEGIIGLSESDDD